MQETQMWPSSCHAFLKSYSRSVWRHCVSLLQPFTQVFPLTCHLSGEIHGQCLFLSHIPDNSVDASKVTGITSQCNIFTEVVEETELNWNHLKSVPLEKKLKHCYHCYQKDPAHPLSRGGVTGSQKQPSFPIKQTIAYSVWPTCLRHHVYNMLLVIFSYITKLRQGDKIHDTTF